MSEHEPMGEDAARAREALRDLARPAAPPEFRARLRAEFVSGAIRPPRRAVARPWIARPAFQWGGVALAAAAAFVVVSLLNRAPAWKVDDLKGNGMVVVDGVPVPTTHTADLARRLTPGALVQVPDGVQFELASRGQLAIQFTPGTEASVPSVPGRWLQRTGTAEVRRGEVRVSTGAGFHGARLDLITPEAHIEVTGTTFAVICEPTGTCLCVMNGQVMMGSRSGGAMHAVDAGRRRYMFNDGRADETAPMRETEHVPLGDFHDRMQPELRGNP